MFLDAAAMQAFTCAATCVSGMHKTRLRVPIGIPYIPTTRQTPLALELPGLSHRPSALGGHIDCHSQPAGLGFAQFELVLLASARRV